MGICGGSSNPAQAEHRGTIGKPQGGYGHHVGDGGWDASVLYERRFCDVRNRILSPEKCSQRAGQKFDCVCAVYDRILGDRLCLNVQRRLLVGIAYPITGHWIWGGGWLAKAGFYDFSGSTAIHSVGGWAALMGAAFLGPRIGKYRNGDTVAMPGHNMSIATLGCLILWLGWFGFNPGSTMAVDPNAIAHIAIATNTAAAFGGVAATLTAWLYLGKPDLSMVINGILAGLVGITAGCAWINVPNAAIIGIVAGILVVFAVTFFDNLKIDDPVGATSVHLVCGVWGTLAVGLFADGPTTGIYTAGPKAGLLVGGGFDQLIPQLIGIISVGGMTVLLSTIFWYALKVLLGIRVSPVEEAEGLDIGEHGMEAYSGFVKETNPGNRAEPGGYGSYGAGGRTKL